MTVGFHSPLPPQRTGVAEYSAALLKYLRQHGSVEMERGRADVHLYHIGNNQLHRGIYERALREPGVAVLHDAVLHHFYLGALMEQQYCDEFVFNYGEWFRDFSRRLWRERARSGSDVRYFRYPMLRRIAETARAVIVHNPAAAEMVRAHAPAARIFEIPHLFVAPAAVEARPHSGVRFGVFGHLRESKRIPAALKAFANVRRAIPGTELIVAGECVSEDFRRAIEHHLHAPGVVRLPYVPDDWFWTNAADTDVCINLRYPAAGETSGITIRFMGIGKPVIVTGGPEMARIPGGACLRAPFGPGEHQAIEDYMIWMASEPWHRRAIGEAAREWIASRHAPELVAAMYWEALRQSA